MHDVLGNSNSLQQNAVEVLIRVVLLVNDVWEILLRPLLENWVFHQLLTVRSFLRTYLDHHLQHSKHIIRKVFRDFGELPLQYLFVQSLHVFCLEWRF